MRVHDSIKKILIVGGGAAGWMSAITLINAVNGKCEIHLVESSDIPTIGVGEATIPPVRVFNGWNGIDERAFLKAVDGTFKLGIQFVNWGRGGTSYFHPFSEFGPENDVVSWYQKWLLANSEKKDLSLDDASPAWAVASRGLFSHPSDGGRSVASRFDYAYHFDAVKFGMYLRQLAEQKGVIRHEGTVSSCGVNSANGDISEVVLVDGRRIAADFFIDCTGFRSLLLGEALGVGFESWANLLPADRALSVSTEVDDKLPPYTTATAVSCGWQWRIPLRHRYGNGLVYSSNFTSENDAEKVFSEQLIGKFTESPRSIKFQTGKRSSFWFGNCLGIGLSAGFLEPLESTSLYLIQSGIMRFLTFFPDKGDIRVRRKEYNKQTLAEYENIRDFLLLHYTKTGRCDSEMWRYYSSLRLPTTLMDKLELYQSNGMLFETSGDVFSANSWLSVLIGQGVLPDHLSSLAAIRSSDHFVGEHKRWLQSLSSAASALPYSHKEYLDRFLR